MTVSVRFTQTKAAPTVLSPSTRTAQVVLALAEQAPLHADSLRLVSGSAVSFAVVPSTYFSVQSVPQSMPAGELDTSPPAVFVTVRVYSFLQTPPSAR